VTIEQKKKDIVLGDLQLKFWMKNTFTSLIKHRSVIDPAPVVPKRGVPRNLGKLPMSSKSVDS
jgi:hypothetical protein